MTPERLLTARELADVLGFTAGTVLDQFERGDLPGFKLPNGAVRFRASEIEAWLDECRRGPGTSLGMIVGVNERS
jgi:excisionase family DNA binding protein